MNGALTDLAIYKQQSGLCFYCQRLLDLRRTGHRDDRRGYTIDHFFPKAAGYTRNDGKVCACFRCNGKKANRWPTRRERNRFDRLFRRGIECLPYLVPIVARTGTYRP